MSKQRFIGPVFLEFRDALKKNDLKSARRLKQELQNLYKKKPKLPPFHRAAEMLYDSKAGKETEAITEARYLAKLPDLYAEIAQSVIDTFENFNYPEELIEYLDDVHKRFKNDRNTTEKLFTHLLLVSRFNQAQVVAMELYRIKKSSQHALYAAAAAFLRARSVDDEIKKFQQYNLNPNEIENLKKQRQLYYNFAIKLVTQSDDKCMDGIQIIVESFIELEQYDNAIAALNENKENTFSANEIIYYRLMIKCLERKEKSQDEENQIAELALKVIEEINPDSIDEWWLIVKYHADPNQIIDKYIDKYRGAFLAKIEYELKQILNKNDIENHINRFNQLVLEYSNKYANKPFVFDDLLPYFVSKKENQNDLVKPILSIISILSNNSTFNSPFVSAITDEMRNKLIDILKSSNDFTIRSYTNGKVLATEKETQFIKNALQTKENIDNENSKILPVYLQYMIRQFNHMHDLNYLYYPISLFFKLNEKQGECQQHFSQAVLTTDSLNFEFENSFLNKESMAILVRASGFLGLTRLQRDIFFASLRVDGIQLLSLAPMIVPDLIRNWDLLLLSEYQQRVGEFTRVSLKMIMTLFTIIPGFNQKNFFASFDLIQFKKDLEMNEVSYFFILLGFLLNGAISLNLSEDVSSIFVSHEDKSEINVDPGMMAINDFNFKKVAPYQKEFVDRYYGKYDTTIYPLYFNDDELQQSIFPTKNLIESKSSSLSSNLVNMNQLLFELNALVNLIFILKTEKEKSILTKSSNNNNAQTSSDLNDILNFVENNLICKNWNIVSEFAKSGKLESYNDDCELSFLQVLALVAIAAISRKEKKNEIKEIVEKEGKKVINRLMEKIGNKVSSDYSDDFVNGDIAQAWKDTVANSLFDNQIKAVNYTIDHLKAAL